MFIPAPPTGIPKTTRILTLASGGVVPPRTYLIGERGPEIFVPLAKCGDTVTSYLLRWKRDLHNGAWFIAEGRRDAREADLVAGIVLTLAYVSAWLIAQGFA